MNEIITAEDLAEAMGRTYEALMEEVQDPETNMVRRMQAIQELAGIDSTIMLMSIYEDIVKYERSAEK